MITMTTAGAIGDDEWAEYEVMGMVFRMPSSIPTEILGSFINGLLETGELEIIDDVLVRVNGLAEEGKIHGLALTVDRDGDMIDAEPMEDGEIEEYISDPRVKEIIKQTREH